MIAPRRFLPSISSLLALEAVDRLGSATAAADELALTHSAVSRQLKVLEEQLGATLLQRKGQGLELTNAGVEYAQTAREVLQTLAGASLRLRADPSGGSLSIAILPAFGMHWLAPRLPQFSAENPDVTVNLGTRLAPFDFNREKYDAAIHFGQRDWQGVEYLALARETVLAVCAPTLMAATATDPKVLLDLPLLHLESRPGAWENWFDAHGTEAEGLRGMLFDQFSTMAGAAALGFGAALLPEYLALSEIESGRLMRAYGDPMRTTGEYFLVWPAGQPPRLPLQRFTSWMTEQAEGDEGSA